MSGPATISLPPAPLSAADAVPLFATLADAKALLVAVSGGPDSVALLALLAEWAARDGRPPLHAATVDHGLREASLAEARAVGTLCARLGIPHAVLTWEGPKPETGIQARARAARYELLAGESARLGGAVVVTAHTLDDQAETLLMRMAHGSGPSGLAGMRPRVSRGQVEIGRPLLSIRKCRLVATAQARGLPFVEDPSNANRRFERVRWRALMPTLAESGLDAGRLGQLASRIGRLEEAVAERARKVWSDVALEDVEPSRVAIRFRDLLQEPEEIALRVVSHALDRVAGERLARLERLETCLAAMREAAREGRRLTRTLAGCMLVLGRDGTLTCGREPERKRGIHPAPS